MKKHILIISILLLIILTMNVPMFNRFIITNGKTGELVYIDSVDNAKELVVSFRHSVNRTPVNEFIKIEGDSFMVYKTTFYSYGAGMPEFDPGSGQRLSIADGLVQIENIDRKLDRFTYMVGTYADHTLSYKGKNMKLSEYVKPQNPASFSIRKITPFELFIYKLTRI